MANGHGGRRPGAGRKGKSEAERALDGNAGHRAKVVAHPSAAALPQAELPRLDESDAPDDLDFAERKVWLELAPHATANGTLTPATALGFKMLCRNIVIEQNYARSVNDKGTANHRGIIQRVDAELLRFNLAPCGKSMPKAVEQPKVDPIEAKYFAGSRA